MGRANKRTPELLDRIVAEVRKGRPMITVAGTVGVSTESIRLWRRDDEDFDRRCEEALAEWVKAKLDIIEKAGFDPKNGAQWAKEALRMRLPLMYGDLGTHVATKRLEKEEIDDTLRSLATEDILRELKRRNEEKGG